MMTFLVGPEIKDFFFLKHLAVVPVMHGRALIIRLSPTLQATISLHFLMSFMFA